MGKLILCNSKIAQTPYCFNMTKTKVYSIEEVCYYIKNNIYMMQEEVFDHGFALWLSDELGMEETAAKLDHMMQDHKNLKDIVVTLCCSCDYYTEAEINELIAIMDETKAQPPRGRRKMRAISYLESGRLELARREYEKILQSEDMAFASMEEYGEIYNSLGVTYARMGEWAEAGRNFRLAYEKNQKMECMQSFLFTLLLSGQKKEYEKNLKEMNLTREQDVFFKAQFNEVRRQAQETKAVRKVERLAKLNSKEDNAELKERMDKLLSKWKREYRLEMGDKLA